MLIDNPTHTSIKGINFRTYKGNLLEGGLSSLRSVERLYPPLVTLGGVTLIPASNSRSHFVLRFDSIVARDEYRDYVFGVGEGKKFGDIIFPEILADYELGEVPYLFIKVTPFLGDGSNDEATYRGLPINIKKLISTGKVAHSIVSKLQ